MAASPAKIVDPRQRAMDYLQEHKVMQLFEVIPNIFHQPP
jgi:hypothetical protein